MNKRRKFGKLYNKHISEIYRFVFLKVSSSDIAEDITSETFKKGWEVFQKEPAVSNFRAYLYQVARNLVIDYYRTKKEHLSSDDLEITDTKEDVEKKAILKDEMETVKRAMKNLKDDYQDIIIFRYLEEMEISEIAKLTQKSEGSIRVLTHRALEALEKELEEFQ